MVLPDSFHYHIFSNDCADIYDNTLTSFTVDAETPIKFKDSEHYEVALHRIVFNKNTQFHSSSVMETTNDVLHLHRLQFPQGTSVKLDKLVEKVMGSAAEPDIYKPDYFAHYSNKGTLYHERTLNSQEFIVDSPDVTAEDTVKNKVEIEIDIKDFLDEKEETVLDFVPKHLHGNPALTKRLQSITLRVYLVPQSLKSIIYCLVLSLLSHHRRVLGELVPEQADISLHETFSKTFF